MNAENGATRLIVPELWSVPGGGTCVATWIRVYAWRGNALADVSQANRAVYEARLQSLTKKIDTVPDLTIDANDAIVNQSCAVMEQDRIERFLGGNAEAGLKHAEAWMSNRDSRLRSNACAALADIYSKGASNRAKADLEKLSQDNECAVEASAITAPQPH